jgi:glycosyltransferase involved in cell wall biosynthesis
VIIAYLVNQYPSTSHSFIRREIRALEELGHTVKRYSIRRSKDGYVDRRDAEEAEKTTVLLSSKPALLGSLLRTATTRPVKTMKAIEQALWHGLRSDRGVLRHVAYLAEACVLLHELEREGVTQLHAHFGTNSTIVARLCRTLGGPEYSFTVHGPEEFDRAIVVGLRRLIEDAKFVAAISHFGRSQLLRLIERQLWDKVAIVRCGVEPGLFAQTVAPIPEAPRLVCVGRLHEQKGQFVLLDAAKLLLDRGIPFELVLAGDGPLRPVLEARISELGLSAQVKITGWIDESRVKSELDAARAMVLPSFAEGLPVVIMEAFALGRPVLSTYVAGIPELVRPGENGWLFPAGDANALARAMEEVLTAPTESLAAMGLSGRRAVERRHDVSKNAATLSRLFASAGASAETLAPDTAATRGGANDVTLKPVHEEVVC